jgi:LCP family protein required for cell wall assembly
MVDTVHSENQPEAMPLLEQPDDVINILVLGSDQRTLKSVGRTDVIIIVSVNPELPSVSMLSIPRDFYAWIPGHGLDKINTAYVRGEKNGYPGGGIESLRATIEYNFGIRVHRYARVGFNDFVEIVDAMGGVDVAVECPLHDTFPDPASETGQSDIDLLPGIHHLNGKQALWYSRSRWSTSDFDRNRRQQQVLRGLYRQALSLDMIARVPDLWAVMKESVAMDLRLSEVLYLANIASKLDMMNVKSRFVGRSVLRSWTAPNGGAVLVPDYEAIGRLVEEAMAPPAANRARQAAFRVEVVNGTGYEGLAFVAAERLGWEGLEVTNVTVAETPVPRTQIIDYTTSAKGSPLPRLIEIYRRTEDDVTSQPSPDNLVDYRVLLGADYDPCAATKDR